MNFIFGQQAFIMNKGKGLMGMMSRTRRRPSRATNNHDDDQLWEDEAVYIGERLKIHATRWQDPHVLDQWGIGEDFNAFITATGLLEFSRHPRGTYEGLAREFISTFRFEGPEAHRYSKRSQAPTPTFTIKFTMRGQRLVMSLEEFCRAIRVENRGSWLEIGADSNQDLVSFWKSISVRAPDRLNRGKFTSIQHPALRYFALFLARGFLARDNTSACTGPIVYLLKCAKEGTPCQFNLGVVLARTLHIAVRRNLTDETPIYGGAIATLVYEHIKEERGFDNNMGRLITEAYLLDFGVTCRMEMSQWHKDCCHYIYKSRNGQNVSIRLPRADLFDRTNGKWTVEEAPP